MKKSKKRYLALCGICMTLALALAACGGKDKKEFHTLQEFIESKDFKDEMDQQIAAYEGTGTSVSLVATETSLVYTYTYESIDIEPNDALTQILTDECEKVKEQMEETIEELEKLVSVENPTIVFYYKDASGKELFSYEFGK